MERELLCNRQRSGDSVSGDITVRAVRRGYLIGRTLPPIGPGPWWEYITLVGNVEDAVAEAKRLAEQDGVSVWFLTGQAVDAGVRSGAHIPLG